MTLPLIDHLALRVRDVRRSRTFYEQALEPFGVKVVESSRGPGFAIEGGGDFWIGEGEPPPLPFMWPSPQPTELPSTSSTAPLSKPAAATTARRVFARITTPGITQRSSLTRTETTSKRSSTVTASCQPRDARLPRCSGISHEQQRRFGSAGAPAGVGPPRLLGLRRSGVLARFSED